ncbi:hypothetical protein FO519_003648 [Halicephalobus sp. NKZ332]|nr:hypothetical protein FO519_003648 [Halicephalobus sp. NKZ332]
MADDELNAVKAERMAQMQGNSGKGPSAEEKAKAAEEQDKMKTNILTQILHQDAMARLSTLRAAKPERAQQVEAMLINMARTGRLGGKLNDEQFRGLLNQVTDSQPKKTTTVKFDRRRAALDSDEDEDY